MRAPFLSLGPERGLELLRPPTHTLTRPPPPGFAQARRFFQEAHALQHKPAALVSAANMALKLGEPSTAKREYEQVTPTPAA